MLPDGPAWTKAVYTMEILALLQAAKSDVRRQTMFVFVRVLGVGVKVFDFL